MLSVGNDATPFTAATVVVPVSVPPPGFAPSATVTLPVKPAAVFPDAPTAPTRTAAELAAPAVACPARAVNGGGLAAAATTVNVGEVAPVSPVAAAVSV